MNRCVNDVVYQCLMIYSDYIFTDDFVPTITLPQREGERPLTTNGIPHVQIGVDFIPEVNQELYRRVYAISGVEQLPSVIGGWQGLSITHDVNIIVKDAILGGREFGHIHDDGSLHIFLEHANGTSPHSHIKYPYDPTQ